MNKRTEELTSGITKGILEQAVALQPLSTEELAMVMAVRLSATFQRVAAPKGSIAVTRHPAMSLNGDKPKRTMSAKARKAIGAAQRERWAKWKAQKKLRTSKR